MAFLRASQRVNMQKILKSEKRFGQGLAIFLRLFLNYNNIGTVKTQGQQMSNNVCIDLFTVSCKDVRLSSLSTFREII